MSLEMGRTVALPFFINQTDLLAGTEQVLVAPCNGWVSGLQTAIQVEVDTGGDITVDVDGTTVDGLTITVADDATQGTVQSAEPTSGHSSRKVSKGDLIEVIPAAAFATAGAVNGFVEISSSEN